ncbi:MAG: CDP-alcohol phosphatidyltransferase family protein [Polyangiaceae bacterium]|nr:CDP-alcohol phosphatidyltransferase family protein [Polyangiaceae bacterium]
MPPLRYFVPNAFTGLSLLLGLASVTMSAQGDFRLAAWMILWGVLLDKLDGTAARLMKATSKFGVEFDSFADFVVFGIAPAALVYYRLLAMGHIEGWHKPALMAASGLYALALAVRLSRFNITTGGEDIFFGLPGTLLGATIASGYLTWEKYGLAESMLQYVPAFLVIAAFLMVSNVRLPKIKLRKSKAFNAFLATNLVVGYICGPLMLFPEYLLACAVTYTVAGVIYCLLNPETSADSATEATAEDAAQERLA